MVITNYKLFENVEKAKKVLSELKLNDNNPKFLELKNLLKKNPGYLGQFTKWYLKDGESIEKIEEVFRKLKNVGIDKPIDEFNKLEDLYDFIQSYEINRKVNQVINQLPSESRKNANDKLKNLISLNIEYASFIKKFYKDKGGRYKTPETLFNDTKDYIENLKGDFNLPSMLKKIEGENVDVIVATPDILMVRVNDYETSCNIGSKHWCISTSESYWKSYVNEATVQFFIWDFTKDRSDKRHMIGATISPGYNGLGKITSAHWSDDTRVENLSYFDEL